MANLNSAITTAVSGLNAQGTAIATLSQNISNSDTVAYKASDTDFASLVTGSGALASGIVTASTSTSLETQGSINATSIATNVAIQGNGFFVVTSNTSNQSTAFNYTRNGAFTTDKNGDLINNEGQYLLGQATDSTGAVITGSAGANSLNSLVPVAVNSTKGAAQSTTKLSIGANLPADAADNAVFTTSATVYDSLGVSSEIVMNWTKDSANTWTLDIANPVLTSDGTTTSGTLSPSSIAVTFNGDGTIATPASATSLSITGWGSGANDSTISLNLGTPGKSDELTQFTSTGNTPAVTVTGINQDGVRFGKLSSISIDKNGLVTAQFDNGLKQPVYQLVLATFPNANGLTHLDGSVYSSGAASGTVVLQDPNQGTAGTIAPSSVEASNTDTTTELSKLVVAQQAYSASSKVISTVSAMYTTLIQAIQ